MEILLLFVFFVGFVSASSYHRTIGIPAAERIKQNEISKNARVFSGYSAVLGTYPYFGGLLIDLGGNFVSVCGSTLITDSKLVTAAHCWDDGEDQAIRFQVVLGSTTLFSGGTRIITTEVKIHEDFDIGMIKNDIAMITIPPITISTIIKPINLPKDEKDKFVNVVGQVIGFGMISDTDDIEATQQLSYADVKVLPDSKCQLYGLIYSKSMICTEGVPSGPCRGDSGGPLIYRTKKLEDLLIGVVSFGSWNGCTSGDPSVHTRITSYMTWINSNV